MESGNHPTVPIIYIHLIREEPEVGLVLDRLKNRELKWNMEQLVSYFIGRTVSPAEWETLKQRVKKGYYLPSPELVELGLLPLPWNPQHQMTSAIQRFLVDLGIADHPPLDELLQMAANKEDTDKREKALQVIS